MYIFFVFIFTKRIFEGLDVEEQQKKSNSQVINNSIQIQNLSTQISNLTKKVNQTETTAVNAQNGVNEINSKIKKFEEDIKKGGG